MADSEIRNARIETTTLGFEDHGIFTFWLMLDYGGAGQGYGGYGLDEPRRDDSGKYLGRRGTAFGCDAIVRLLEVLDVDSWEKLPGKPCRVKGGGCGSGGIEAIGHYLKDQWLDLKALAAEHKVPE